MNQGNQNPSLTSFNCQFAQSIQKLLRLSWTITKSIYQAGKLVFIAPKDGDTLIQLDVNRGKYDVVVKVDGFFGEMEFYKDYFFIRLSKLRKSSSTFWKSPTR